MQDFIKLKQKPFFKNIDKKIINLQDIYLVTNEVYLHILLNDSEKNYIFYFLCNYTVSIKLCSWKHKKKYIVYYIVL